MKKVLFILLNFLTVTVMAQTKGRFEVHDLGNYRLHVYYTNDALGDASYIIEGKDALVTMQCGRIRLLSFHIGEAGGEAHHGLSCGRNRET